jgi:peptidoglycan/LPS O-acetylase OafA/YrhL
LGRISYSFYLLHWMIVVLVARAVDVQAPAWGPLASTLAIFGGGFALSAAAATLSWWLTERPYFGWVRASRT